MIGRLKRPPSTAYALYIDADTPVSSNASDPNTPMRLLYRSLLVPLATLGLACEPNSARASAPTVADDEKALTQIEDNWGNALIKRDGAAIQAIVAPEYRGLDSDGNIYQLADILAVLKSGKLSVDTYRVEKYKVLVIGDTAVVYGFETEVSSYDKKDTSGHFCWSDVYLRRNGHWQCISTQETRLPGH
jgi:hypothetical protein